MSKYKLEEYMGPAFTIKTMRSIMPTGVVIPEFTDVEVIKQINTSSMVSFKLQGELMNAIVKNSCLAIDVGL